MEENKEEDVWLYAWIAYTRSGASSNPADAARWADKCLEDFRKRFPKDKAQCPNCQSPIVCPACGIGIGT